VHAVEVELGVDGSVGAGPDVEILEGGVVEFLEGLAARRDGRLTAFG